MNEPTIGRTLVTLLVLAILAFGGYHTGYEDGEQAHADDYDAGYEAGYDEGYDVGYTEGYDEAEWNLGENDLNGYLGPAPSSSTVYH